jgi:rod shape-determining protein MreC
MEFLTRFKNALFLIMVLLTQAIALAVQVRRPVDPAEPDGPSVRLIRLWGTAAVTPFEVSAHAIGYVVGHGWSDYIDLRHVRQQNRQLQQELTRMRIEQAAVAEDALEGRRLQGLLAFRQRYVVATVAAQVIGSSGSDQSRVLTIDKGWRDGLKPDMAVITPDGIVGKLRDVFPTTSQVLEIDDQTSGAGVILASTRIRAILRGSLTGRVQILNLTADSRIKPGETVLTSGGDQVYPRGFPVGTIESIAPDPDHQPYVAIAVRPAVNLAQVEEVLVITGTQSAIGAAADGAVSTPATTPVITAVPKPLPAVHPDRFSTGETPPADEMTPGAAHAARAATVPSSPEQGGTQPQSAAPPVQKNGEPAQGSTPPPPGSQPAAKKQTAPAKPQAPPLPPPASPAPE